MMSGKEQSINRDLIKNHIIGLDLNKPKKDYNELIKSIGSYLYSWTVPFLKQTKYISPICRGCTNCVDWRSISWNWRILSRKMFNYTTINWGKRFHVNINKCYMANSWPSFKILARIISNHMTCTWPIIILAKIMIILVMFFVVILYIKQLWAAYIVNVYY